MNFPPLYVISLDRATSRREHIRKQFELQDIPYEFFAAVDGKTLSADSVPGYDATRRAKRLGSVLSTNQLACALSHIRLFEKIAAAEAPYSIIVEDDVCLSEHFKSSVELIPTIHHPWDHLRLGGLKKRRFVPRQTLGNGVEVGVYTGPVWGAEGYALTPKGAKKLLQYKDLQLYIIDQAMERFWENGLVSLGVFPFVLNQAEESVLPSMIGYVQESEAKNSRAQTKNLSRRFRRVSDMFRRRWYNMNHRNIYWDPPRSLIRNQIPRKVRPSLKTLQKDGKSVENLRG